MSQHIAGTRIFVLVWWPSSVTLITAVNYKEKNCSVFLLMDECTFFFFFSSLPTRLKDAFDHQELII